MGDTLSVLDIAGSSTRTSCRRLAVIRSPAAWYQELLALPEFAKDIAMAPHVAEAVATAQRTH